MARNIITTKPTTKSVSDAIKAIGTLGGSVVRIEVSGVWVDGEGELVFLNSGRDLERRGRSFFVDGKRLTPQGGEFSSNSAAVIITFDL